MLCHWWKWISSVLNAVFLRVIFNGILFLMEVYSSMWLQKSTATLWGEWKEKKIIIIKCFCCIFYFVIFILLTCCSSGHKKLCGSVKQNHHFQLHICDTSESWALPWLYDRAEQHNLVWRSVILQWRHFFCSLRQDTTLLCKSFSFWQCYADCEEQMPSGPFNIRIAATEINKDRKNIPPFCHVGTLALNHPNICV